jgi:pimeloyl-ACP methyl ester carboxylesterase
VSEEVHRVLANGLSFAYLEAGAGPLVLLLHGFPDTAHTWDDVRPRLAAKGYRAVSPFMRGYQPTGIPATDADDATTAKDALALISALGAESAIVIGHDWGASAAYGAASLDPARVSKLFAVGVPHPATLRVTLRKLWGVRHFFAYQLPGAAARFAKDDFAALPAICHRWSPTWSPSAQELAPVRDCFTDERSLDAAFGYYRAMSFRARPHLRRPIEVPTVVFAGTDDPNLEPADYHLASRKFRSSYVVEEMPGGHFMHREHPAIFAQKLLAHFPGVD